MVCRARSLVSSLTCHLDPETLDRLRLRRPPRWARAVTGSPPRRLISWSRCLPAKTCAISSILAATIWPKQPSLALAAAARDPDLVVTCVPKTIDNDLPGMDHCPGYGSAARFLAQATADAGRDTEAMRLWDPIKIVEVMAQRWMAGGGDQSGCCGRWKRSPLDLCA